MLDEQAALRALQTTVTLGLGVWFAVAVVNNLAAFQASAEAIGRVIAMSALESPPMVESPLLKRKLVHRRWAYCALVVVVCLQSIAAVTLLFGGAVMIIDSTQAAWARAVAFVGLCVSTVIWLIMLTAGAWFGYWIRQEGLQLTHLGLLLVTLVASLLLVV